MARDTSTHTIAFWFGKHVVGPLYLLPRVARYSVVLVVIITFFALVFAWGSRQEKEFHTQAEAEAKYRASLTNPIELAQYDRTHHGPGLALQDLNAITQDSPYYGQAMALSAQIQREIRLSRPANTRKAEDACRTLTKEGEEFPSTVDFDWLGSNSKVDRDTMTITVTADYTAKNQLGAELPYRMTCYASYDGDVFSHSRSGR